MTLPVRSRDSVSVFAVQIHHHWRRIPTPEPGNCTENREAFPPRSSARYQMQEPKRDETTHFQNHTEDFFQKRAPRDAPKTSSTLSAARPPPRRAPRHCEPFEMTLTGLEPEMSPSSVLP